MDNGFDHDRCWNGWPSYSRLATVNGDNTTTYFGFGPVRMSPKNPAQTGDRRVIEYLLSPVMQAVKEAGRER